ncbi:MAG: hypothetical protein ACYDCO_01880 [Armatimonadota bacterium]
MKTLCDEWVETHPHLKRHPNHLVRKHGKGPEGKRCKDCCHLYGKDYSKRYYKCSLAGHRGPNTDWRCNWDACALFEAGEVKIYNG